MFLNLLMPGLALLVLIALSGHWHLCSFHVPTPPNPSGRDGLTPSHVSCEICGKATLPNTTTAPIFTITLSLLLEAPRSALLWKPPILDVPVIATSLFQEDGKHKFLYIRARPIMPMLITLMTNSLLILSTMMTWMVPMILLTMILFRYRQPHGGVSCSGPCCYWSGSVVKLVGGLSFSLGDHRRPIQHGDLINTGNCSSCNLHDKYMSTNNL